MSARHHVTAVVVGIVLMALAPGIRLAFAAEASPAATSVAGEDAQRARARQWMEQALDRYLRDNDAAAARKALMEVQAMDPAFAAPLFNLGVIAEDSETWSEAIGWYSKAAQAGAETATGQAARWRIEELKLVEEKDRTEDGKRARRYEDKIAKARYLARIGFGKEAIAVAGAARDLDANRWEAYAVTAGVLIRNGLSAQAQPFLQQAIRRAPEAVRRKLISTTVP